MLATTARALARWGTCSLLVAGVAFANAGAQATPSQPPRPREGRLLSLLQSITVVNAPELAAAVNAILTDTSAHMRMGPRRDATPADSARAAALVVQARAALAPYADVHAAERDGYVRFLPFVEEQTIYHYNSFRNVFSTMSAFDATRPVSLLYRKDGRGEMVLVGAMYSAMPSATAEDLDARLPIGVAHWHEHVNFCGPRPDSARAAMARADSAATRRLDGAEMARWLRITTREACDSAGGRFVPRLFGWMAHVYLFAGDDPATIWGGEEHDHMHMHPAKPQPSW